MDYTELDKLEANVKQMIEKIQNLHSENLRLKQENQNLLNRLRENERIIQKLKNSTPDDGETAEQLFYHKEKEGKVKQKIQQMLDKLETLNQLSNNE